MGANDSRIRMTYRPARDVYLKLREAAFKRGWSHEEFLDKAVREYLEDLAREDRGKRSLKSSKS